MGLSNFLSTILSPSESQPEITKDDLKNYVIIDVRSPMEFMEGHIDNAINIPHTEIGDRITKAVKAQDKPILLYCRSGARSGAALGVLRQKGYTAAVNGGGIDSVRRLIGR